MRFICLLSLFFLFIGTNLYPQTAQEYYNQGIQNFYNDDYDLAIKNFTNAVEVNKDFAEAYLMRGRCKIENDDNEDAIKDIDRSITINPNDETFYFYKASAYNHLKDLDQALYFYSKAINIKKDYADAYYDRGVVYKNKELYELALDDMDTAINLNPKNAKYFLNRGIIHSLLKEYQKGIDDYTSSIKIDSTLKEAYFGRGMAYYMTTKADEACADFKIAYDLGFEKAGELMRTSANKTIIRMYASKSKIIPRVILFVILAVIVYFSMNMFPGMVKIAAPIVCGGDFSVQIKAHEYCYICRDGSGAEEDITSKTYYTALFINTVIAYAMLYILGILIRYVKNKKGKNSFEDYQNQYKKTLFQSSQQQNQQDFFHQQTTIISGDLELKIINELKANRKINAIKICRDATGLGLKDAKDKVEEIERTNGIRT